MLRFAVIRDAIAIRTTTTKELVSRLLWTKMRKHLTVPNINISISYQNLVKRIQRLRIKSLYLRLIPKSFKLWPITLIFTWIYTYRTFWIFIFIICTLLGKRPTYIMAILKNHSKWIDFWFNTKEKQFSKCIIVKFGTYRTSVKYLRQVYIFIHNLQNLSFVVNILLHKTGWSSSRKSTIWTWLPDHANHGPHSQHQWASLSWTPISSWREEMPWCPGSLISCLT